MGMTVTGGGGGTAGGSGGLGLVAGEGWGVLRSGIMEGDGGRKMSIVVLQQS